MRVACLVVWLMRTGVVEARTFAAVIAERALANRQPVDLHSIRNGPSFAFPSMPQQEHMLENQQHQNVRRVESEQVAQMCDSAFMQCLGVEKCVECFMELQTEEIDWASVSEDTPCGDVVDFIKRSQHCTSLTGSAVDTFCTTFNACVVWNDDDLEEVGDDDDAISVDCSKLTSCYWEGMHPSFLGNGVCNDALEGCYNTAVCGYDGGDCCEDTCKTNATSLVECGHDGFYCRDPDSTTCNAQLATNCLTPADNGIKPAKVNCTEGTTQHRIIMYDSFGDGWDDTKMKLSPSKTPSDTKEFSLKSGSQGTEYVCLSKVASCYHAEVMGGIWGNEVSWELRPMTEGAPAMAGGGAPTDCYFPVAGGDCGSQPVCSGKPNIKPSDDPEYKELKELFSCIEDKCLIQVAACKNDKVCLDCYQEEPADYCYGNDLFNSLIDCSLCQCTSDRYSTFCTTKTTPGAVVPPSSNANGGTTMRDCSPAETISGGAAVMNFGKCVDVDQVTMLVSDFRNDNFGDLDKFETCAHEFASQDLNHGGHTALGCLQILVNAMNGAMADESDSDRPVEAIKALATSLYRHGESFCDCAVEASNNCPLCQSFVHFKTLLYESLDACKSLDEIDCDAWKEFYRPCLTNLSAKFGSTDFSKKDQCDFVHDTCGGAGPFPSFRRLDCEAEVSSEAWDFYSKFATACLKDDGGGSQPQPQPQPASTAPKPAPTAPKPAPVTPSGGKPTPKPYIPKDNDKPYVPPPDNSKPSDSKQTPEYKPKKGRFRWFWNTLLLGLLIGGGYYYYKRRSEGFTFVRYRRMRNNFRDDADMYSGLALESSTSFAPPTLPPTPGDLS